MYKRGYNFINIVIFVINIENKQKLHAELRYKIKIIVFYVVHNYKLLIASI